MSAEEEKKLVRISSHRMKKVSPRRLKNIFDAIGRKLFGKVHRNEVEYGQTLSKKRRKNCVLKSVSSLSRAEDDDGFLLHSPYRIDFRFAREDSHFRGSVANFQKIDVRESCCEKCCRAERKGRSLSRFSLSSDSACDVSSESSCDDRDCEYRRSRAKKKKNKSVGAEPGERTRTVEDFIRIHRENFVEDVEADAENGGNSLWKWTEEEADDRPEEPTPAVDDPEYDILVTRSGCRVLEPSYENLKLVENFYETPESETSVRDGEEKGEEVPSHKTYDEVIQSLKLWHLSPRYPEGRSPCSCCGEERMDNEFNHCVEGYESLENDFNNDIEEFSC